AGTTGPVVRTSLPSSAGGSDEASRLAAALETARRTRRPVASRSYDEAAAQWARIIDGITRIRAEIDRTQFDLDALATRLGSDAADIITFVRREIAFEQYPGLLRGAQ